MSTDMTRPAPGPPAAPPAAAAGAPRSQGLDGLRALAVTAVVVYHLWTNGLPGGFIGVDLFFVISGYLITSLLTAERDRTGRMRLRAFWVRRARRLLPALWAVLVVAACAATLLGGDTYAGLRGTVLAALTYSSNWWQVARHDAYFAGVGGRPVLQHLWSLAVEEQFYVLWPMLLWAVLSLVRGRRRQAAATAGLAGCCFALMAWLFSPDTDTSRVYYGTDTHGGGLLLGAAAALLVPLARAGGPWPARSVRLLDRAGFAGLGVLALAALLLDGTGAATYRGGLAISCAASVAVTVAACAPGRLARSLSWPPLVWVGRRSYGIYLWHWPLIAVLADAAPRLAASPAGHWLVLAATVLIAAASHRALEEPLIRLGTRAYLTAGRRWFEERAEQRPQQALALAVAAAGVVTVAAIGVAHAPGATGLQAQIAAGQRLAADPPGASPAATSAVAPGPSPAAPGVPDRGAPAPRPPTGPNGTPFAVVDGRDTGGHEHGTAIAARPPVTGEDLTAVGDSVMLASADALRHDFPGIAVEAKVGRQMDAAPGVLRDLAAAGRLRHTVVIGLGTNGGFGDSVIDDVLRITGPGRTVAFVDVHVPKPWQDGVNAALRRAVVRHPGTLLVDWNAVISPAPERLWTDRTHPRPSGTGLYADAVRDTLARAAGG
ncbi:acyltransferase family protein [Streptomyces sp. SL13]|uniref:Acyltransferase family protein n=1 Tax=Streptantibioticus silvisoli TaxID=2705255 RepID=A0AA90KBI6_9ACTN|nr:acyltransferase family protein [Streptantibioticus silvisoli]MDI5961823.1 acyltransferase family protein [Streptantibioticus silvisoli]MDI5973377.1 acyltransferase family protein [Streptantibioticus silvisoli]